MIDDRTVRMSPEILARYNLKLPENGGGLNLQLPENVAAFLRGEVAGHLQRREHLGAVFLDRNAGPLAYTLSYHGYLGRTHIESRRIVTPAMICEAAGLIVFHNRPRGRRAIPRRDASIARTVRQGCELMGVHLLDYLVLGRGDAWTSLREQRRVRFHSLGDDLPDRGRDGRARVEPKYRSPDSPHQTWSGRGRMANWLRAKLDADPQARVEDFAIED